MQTYDYGISGGLQCGLAAYLAVRSTVGLGQWRGHNIALFEIAVLAIMDCSSAMSWRPEVLLLEALPLDMFLLEVLRLAAW